MKYFIVNAYGRSNRGDSVLLDECISEVRRFDPSGEISCSLFYGVDDAAAVYPDINWSLRIGNSTRRGLVGRLETLFYMFISLLAVFPLLRFLIKLLPIEQQNTFKGVLASDYVISAPGGYIHDTNFSYYVALVHIYLGVALNKRVILAPQSYGPIRSKFGRLVASFVLSKCDAVCSREGYSHQFLKSTLFLDDGILRRCGDSAFFNPNEINTLPDIDDEYQSVLKGSKRILGLTVVGWNFPHRANPAEDYHNYLKSFARAIDRLSIDFDLQPIVFNQVDGDRETACKLKDLCAVDVYVDGVSREPEYLRPLISQSYVFIGTRFHSCIFAMMENVPTMAISYLPKTEFIMKDLGFSDRFVDINSVDEGLLYSVVENYLSDIDKAKIDLDAKLCIYRGEFGTLGSVLRDVRG